MFLPDGLSPAALDRMQRLYALVLQENQTTNLTRITTVEGFLIQHLLDSLSLSPLLPADNSPFTLIDIGTGAGFPAIPLAVCFPNAQIVAVESVQKKARFVASAVQALELSNVTVQAVRSEDLSRQPAFRDVFDVAVARAVAPLNSLAELCLPFVKPGGQFLAMKTRQALEKEIPEANRAIQVLGGALPVPIQAVSSDWLPNRAIAIVQKQHPTPAAYPRKAGLPRKTPL